MSLVGHFKSSTRSKTYHKGEQSWGFSRRLSKFVISSPSASLHSATVVCIFKSSSLSDLSQPSFPRSPIKTLEVYISSPSTLLGSILSIIITHYFGLYFQNPNGIMAPRIQVQPEETLRTIQNILKRRYDSNRIMKEREKEMLSGEEYQLMEVDLNKKSFLQPTTGLRQYQGQHLLYNKTKYYGLNYRIR
jgi:hypothetical protein